MAKAKTLTDAQMLTLAQHVRANDLLLAGRDPEDAPEGAGGWRYLLADAMGVAREDVTHVTVPTKEVNRLREIDKAARTSAKTPAPEKKAATRKRTTTRKAPAKAQTVEIAPPANVTLEQIEAIVARMIAGVPAAK